MLHRGSVRVNPAGAGTRILSPPEPVYRPRRPSRSRVIEARGLALHLRLWGEPGRPPLVLLHGSRDASATFQFLVDALAGDWFAVAPDWRGHGLSGWSPCGYAFTDYLADLDHLLGDLFPGRPVPLVGHSLGGNVALVYAGVRPEQVSGVVSLDAFGVPDRDPSEAPAHLRRWLEAGRRAPPDPAYPSREAMAERLVRANPRLDLPRARFLAGHLGREDGDGRFRWCLDPRHRLPFAGLHRRAEWAACLAEVRAPALYLASERVYPAFEAEPGGFAGRLAQLPPGRLVRLDEAGHNLHHDAPGEAAALVEAFASDL